jgi:hypothetical protein
MTIHNELGALLGYGPLEATMRGVILEHVYLKALRGKKKKGFAFGALRKQ